MMKRYTEDKMLENKGLVIESPGMIKLMDLPFKKPEAAEVLVRVRYVALCGSDIKLYQGNYSPPHKYPVVVGHEWVGEIVEVGKASAKGWKAGDIVTGDCSLFCGTCSYCGINRNHCRQIEKRGITKDGACCRFITVETKHIYKCPRLPDIKPLALAEPLAVTVQGIINRVSPGELRRIRRALIIGSGGIGIMSLFSLLEYRIEEIVIVDKEKDKLHIVSSLEYPNVTTNELNLAGDSLESKEGFDLIVEATGNSAAAKRAIELANPCGIITCLGHQGVAEVDFGSVVRKSLSIHASNGSTGGFEKAIEIIEKNYVNISKAITKIVPLKEAEEYFRTRLPLTKEIKVLIDLE